MTADALLQAFADAGVLEPLEVHFARTAARLGGEDDPVAVLGAALACRAPRAGHVCLEVARAAGALRDEGLRGEVRDLPWPGTEAWLAALRRSPLVGDGGTGARPLVLEDDRLYLERLWRLEDGLARDVLARARTRPAVADEARLAADLRRLFPGDGDEGQRRATLAATLCGLSVISGGPGTGKTSVVVKVLALLFGQAQAAAAHGAAPPRVLLAAPTGKAAARLADAVRLGRESLRGIVDDAILDALPTEASTLHRALGVLPDRPGRFRHSAANPLPRDVVVVDEASMVDVVMMARLVEAVPPAARLVLLGDRDQLASVEAGSVLGDLCNAGESLPPPSRPFALSLQRLAGLAAAPGGGEAPALADAVVQLDRSWRFGADSGIGRLARAIQAGRADEALDLLRSGGTGGDLEWLDPGTTPRAADLLLEGAVADARAVVLAAAGGDVDGALSALDAARVLCAHRRGPLGAEDVVRRVESRLSAAGLRAPDGSAYPGRPVMVTRNDPALGLFNGDTGVLAPALDDPTRLEACFRGPAGLRRLSPGRLPAGETAWALTVHKSQGSQFDRVQVVLPDRPSPVLTRELLYTAVTRAVRGVTVLGSEPVLRAAIAERVRRFSGLRRKWWG